MSWTIYVRLPKHPNPEKRKIWKPVQTLKCKDVALSMAAEMRTKYSNHEYDMKEDVS
jgi:hypothetical protein